MSINVPSLSINVNLIPGLLAPAEQKKVLLFGQHYTEFGTLTPGSAGFFNYYIPQELPSFANGTAAMDYLKSFGINVKMGIDITLTLPPPDTVTFVNGLTVVTWTTTPTNFAQLTGFDLSGTLAQTSLSAPVFRAYFDGGVATMSVYGTIAYVLESSSGTDMTLTGVNNIDYPDPDSSDPIALMVWDFYETALSANQSGLGAPQAYISMLSDRDSSITPSDEPITLGDPAAVTTGPTSTLTYPLTTEGLGYLPKSMFGQTTVTQVTSLAAGIYAGYEIDGSNVIITVINVTGTFNTSDAVSVTLDNTINGWNFTDNLDFVDAVLQFPINTSDDITVTQADFFNGLLSYNAANQVLNQHFWCIGMAGNITILPTAASTLTTQLNSYYGVLVTYPYIYKFGKVPYDNTNGNVASGRVAACVAYLHANGDAPYPNLINCTIKHLPIAPADIAATTSYSPAPGNTGSIAISQGWLPLYPNNGVVTLLSSNTTLITLPNSSAAAGEFAYTHEYACVRWYKREITNWWEINTQLPNNQGRVNLSPQFLQQTVAAMIAIANRGELLGLFENVESYENLFIAIQDPQNPMQEDITAPCQIIPGLLNGDVTIDVFASQFNFSANV